MIRVGIIDDSALVRSLLSHIVNSQPDMRVVGTARDAHTARRMIKRAQPDVLTLDVEMPGMSGIEFLERLMRLHPLPVVMVSSVTARDAPTTLRALELGAVDVIAKPSIDISTGMLELAATITERIRAAAEARVRAFTPATSIKRLASGAGAHAGSLILIGASTGGTEAILEVLAALPADSPPIAIAQHMPALFTKTFAERMNRVCAVRVAEAADGEPLVRGHAYLAPGGLHLLIERGAAGFRTRLSEAPPVERQRPSVDVLFASVAAIAGKKVIAALLTGMGRDGAAGLLALRQAGALTIAQDKETSVIFGMPKAAIDLGAASLVLPLGAIAGEIVSALRAQAAPRKST